MTMLVTQPVKIITRRCKVHFSIRKAKSRLLRSRAKRKKIASGYNMRRKKIGKGLDDNQQE